MSALFFTYLAGLENAGLNGRHLNRQKKKQLQEQSVRPSVLGHQVHHLPAAKPRGFTCVIDAEKSTKEHNANKPI